MTVIWFTIYKLWFNSGDWRFSDISKTNRVISTAKIRNKHPDISKNTAVILQNLIRNCICKSVFVFPSIKSLPEPIVSRSPVSGLPELNEKHKSFVQITTYMSRIAKTTAVERRSIKRINQSFFGSINPRIVIVRMKPGSLHGNWQREGESVRA